METRMAQQEAYFEIVKQIAPDDPEVLLALREGFSHPEAYADRHRERLQKEYWLEPEELSQCVRDPWWLMLDILQRYGSVCVRDWKDEWQDFRFFLCQTKRAQQEEIVIQESDLAFSENGDIRQWCSRLDEKLAERNLVVENIDTESDAYAVFFVPGKNWLRCSNLPACFTTGFILRKMLDSKQKAWTKLSRLF